MTWIEVLVEGTSDVPAVKEVLQRRFGLAEGEHFRIHPHRGKGNLPENVLAKPALQHQGLLDQLPAKLRGFGKSLLPQSLVLVVVDVDNEPCTELLAALTEMLAAIPDRPNVLFRLAIEETESWFIADLEALEKAYPGKVKRAPLRGVRPDQVVGAWEKLAAALGLKTNEISPTSKYEWAEKIAPHLNLDAPISPSLLKLIQGLSRYLEPEPA